MATTYVVLREWPAGREGEKIVYIVVEQSLEANNAEHARRRAAERLPAEEVDDGVTLVAVPARNWKTGHGTLKAETQRRIRSA